jgi:hypothetical protein
VKISCNDFNAVHSVGGFLEVSNRRRPTAVLPCVWMKIPEVVHGVNRNPAGKLVLWPQHLRSTREVTSRETGVEETSNDWVHETAAG